jgi:hypothetical protein
VVDPDRKQRHRAWGSLGDQLAQPFIGQGKLGLQRLHAQG